MARARVAVLLVVVLLDSLRALARTTSSLRPATRNSSASLVLVLSVVVARPRPWLELVVLEVLALLQAVVVLVPLLRADSRVSLTDLLRAPTKHAHK